MNMETEIVKIKVIDAEAKEVVIVELSDLESLADNIKKTVRENFSESLLIFVGDANSRMSFDTLFRIAKTVRNIVGEELEWKITDKKPQSMELEGLSAYLILREKRDE
jgi:hypothetical protein